MGNTLNRRKEFEWLGVVEMEKGTTNKQFGSVLQRVMSGCVLEGSLEFPRMSSSTAVRFQFQQSSVRIELNKKMYVKKTLGYDVDGQIGSGLLDRLFEQVKNLRQKMESLRPDVKVDMIGHEKKRKGPGKKKLSEEYLCLQEKMYKLVDDLNVEYEKSENSIFEKDKKKEGSSKHFASKEVLKQSELLRQKLTMLYSGCKDFDPVGESVKGLPDSIFIVAELASMKKGIPFSSWNVTNKTITPEHFDPKRGFVGGTDEPIMFVGGGSAMKMLQLAFKNFGVLWPCLFCFFGMNHDDEVLKHFEVKRGNKGEKDENELFIIHPLSTLKDSGIIFQMWVRMGGLGIECVKVVLDEKKHNVKVMINFVNGGAQCVVIHRVEKLEKEKFVSVPENVKTKYEQIFCEKLTKKSK